MRRDGEAAHWHLRFAFARPVGDEASLFRFKRNRPNTAFQRSGWIRAFLASRSRKRHYRSIKVIHSSRPLNANPFGRWQSNTESIWK